MNANSSLQSLSLSCYSVPSFDGGLIPATPISFALKYNPPTLAVVYTINDDRHINPKNGRLKKYVHNIVIPFEQFMYDDVMGDGEEEPVDIE